MTGVIIAAIIAQVKAQLIAQLEAFKGKLPDVAGPVVDQVIAFLGTVFDSIDVAALEADLPGRVLELLKAGHGPSSSQPVDLA